jgi:HEAT repeat protein/beta-lactamase regulating signal transducer with metallopeptidase domain
VSTIWIVSTLLKGTALLLLAIVIAAVLRRAPAALRHLVWGTVIATVLVLPFVSALSPWRIPVAALAPEIAVRREISTPPPPMVATPATAPAGSTVVQDAGTPVPENAPSIWRLSRSSPLALLLGIWALGLTYLLGRLILGAVVLGRVIRCGTPLDTPEWRRPLLEAADRLALERLPRLVMSDRLPMPFACGLLHPAIVLPSGAAEWDDRRRRTVLFHELAHLTRYDLVVNTLGQLTCAIYWFHPLVWMAVRRLRIESERACDDLVLGVGTRPSEYADHLLQIVCRASRARTPAIALPMAQRHEFEGRMLAILERAARRDPASSRHAAVLGALALALVIPLAALVPSRRTDIGQPGPAPQTQVANQLSESVRFPRRAAASPAQTSATTARAAVAASQGTDSAGVIAALVRALSDSVASVREDAAYALGHLGAAAAIDPLVTRLSRDPAEKVREMIAWSLGQIGEQRTTAALGAAAQRDSSEVVRAMAVWALGQLADPASASLLTAVLRDPSAEVRGRAAWALGQIAPAASPAGLVSALHDPSSDVRLRAAWALGQIADSTAVPQLAGTLRDSTGEVRRAALWALGQIGGDAAQGALLQALDDKDPEVRARAARALAGNHADPWPWPWPMPIIR